jgi:hypothetical protein
MKFDRGGAAFHVEQHDKPFHVTSLRAHSFARAI